MTASSGVQVHEFMSTKPIHVSENDTLLFIMNMFERTRISGAPVTNMKGEYIGVISKTDLASPRLLKHLHQLGETTAKECMHPGKPITIRKDAPLELAVDLMLEHHIHRVFVEDETGRIIGVLSSFDIMRAIKRPEPEPVAEKPAAKPAPLPNNLHRTSPQPETFALPPLPAIQRSTAHQSASRQDQAMQNSLRSPQNRVAPAGTVQPAATKSPTPASPASNGTARTAAREKDLDRQIFTLITQKREEISRHGANSRR